MKKKTLVIATRESPLALWQANWVKQHLESLSLGLSVSLLGITTEADTMDLPLTQAGGKGLFVKELEEALLEGRADIAVHSMKDVPMDLPAGLCLPVICKRDIPNDVFVSPQFKTLERLPPNAIVGTSSLRRASQLKALRRDIIIEPLRGNVQTRLKKCDDGKYAAIILAAAGLIRLNLEDRISSVFNVTELLPAAGQGVLGIECRENDTDIFSLISPLNHFESAACVTAERALCRRLGGGCQAPVAAFAEIKENRIFLRGRVGSLDGSILLCAEETGFFSSENTLGEKVAEKLLQLGAGELLSCQTEKN